MLRAGLLTGSRNSPCRGQMVTSPKDFFSIRPHKVLYLESIWNSPLFPPKSSGATRTRKRPPARQEEGQLGAEVKLDDCSVEFSLALECQVKV